VFSIESHHFGKVIPKFVALWTKKYKKLAKQKSITDESFNECTAEIKSFSKSLIASLFNYYNGLDDVSENVRHLCEVSIQDSIFQHIYKDIFEIFKRRNAKEDEFYKSKFKSLLTVSAAHLGIPQNLWLTDVDIIIDSDNTKHVVHTQPDGSPYHASIALLQKISDCTTAQAKLKCLVETAKSLINEIKDHYKKVNLQLEEEAKREGKVFKPLSEPLIGGDEILPLYCYIGLKANIPFVYSESAFVEQFITDQQSTEETGYFLATFQTFLSFVESVNKDTLEKSAAETIAKQAKKQSKKLSNSIDLPSSNISSNANANSNNAQNTNNSSIGLDQKPTKVKFNANQDLITWQDDIVLDTASPVIAPVPVAIPAAVPMTVSSTQQDLISFD